MWKKCWNCLIYDMGYCSIFWLILSAIYPESSVIRGIHISACVGIPVSFFSFFTMYLKLFSRHLWVRRGIVVLFSYFVMVAVLFAFGSLTLENWKGMLVYIVLIFAIIAVVTAFIWYVSDKIEKRNLDAINKKLADETESKTEESS